MKYFKVKSLNKNHLLLNIPHNSLKIPKKYKKEYLLKGKELKSEAKSMADMYTAPLFSGFIKGHDFLKMEVNRILVDIERFSNEKLEPMSKVGMSALYTKTKEGKDLRVISKKSRAELLKIYKDFHKTFERIVQKKLTKHGKCLIFDLHSFPNKARMYEPDQKPNRPEICIGTDPYHTPSVLTELLVKNFSKAGYSVLVNSPFAGSLVPNKYYKKNKKVQSIMIEINRKVYMDENTFNKNKDFINSSKKICEILNRSLKEFVNK